MFCWLFRSTSSNVSTNCHEAFSDLQISSFIAQFISVFLSRTTNFAAFENASRNVHKFQLGTETTNIIALWVDGQIGDLRRIINRNAKPLRTLRMSFRFWCWQEIENSFIIGLKFLTNFLDAMRRCNLILIFHFLLFRFRASLQCPFWRTRTSLFIDSPTELSRLMAERQRQTDPPTHRCGPQAPF